MVRIHKQTERWMLAGWVLLLCVLFLHPAILEALGKDHPDNCPLCAHYSNGGIFLPAFSFLPFLVFLGYALAIPARKFATRSFLVSSGRAPPAVF